MLKLAVFALLVCAATAQSIVGVQPLGYYGGQAYDGIDNLGLTYSNNDLAYGRLGLGYGRLGLGYGILALGYGNLDYGRLGLGYGRLGLGYGRLGLGLGYRRLINGLGGLGYLN